MFAACFTLYSWLPVGKNGVHFGLFDLTRQKTWAEERALCRSRLSAAAVPVVIFSVFVDEISGFRFASCLHILDLLFLFLSVLCAPCRCQPFHSSFLSRSLSSWSLAVSNPLSLLAPDMFLHRSGDGPCSLRSRKTCLARVPCAPVAT